MTDELRERLARLDPMHPAVPTESVTTESSRQVLEDIMSTSPTEQPVTEPAPKRSRWAIGAAAAAALVLAVGGAVALLGDGTGGDTVATEPPLELNAGGGEGTTTASCIAFSVEVLAPMEVAFEGTATSVDGDEVTLTVDHWFKGGDSAQVVLNAPQGLEALIASFPLEEGQQYLITASQGNVNYCGFSGPSTPEMRAAFEEAFPG